MLTESDLRRVKAWCEHQAEWERRCQPRKRGSTLELAWLDGRGKTGGSCRLGENGGSKELGILSNPNSGNGLSSLPQVPSLFPHAPSPEPAPEQYCCSVSPLPPSSAQ